MAEAEHEAEELKEKLDKEQAENQKKHDEALKKQAEAFKAAEE